MQKVTNEQQKEINEYIVNRRKIGIDNELPFELDYDAMEKVGFALYCFEDFLKLRGDFFDIEDMQLYMRDFMFLAMSNLCNASYENCVSSCYEYLIDILEESLKAKDRKKSKQPE